MFIYRTTVRLKDTDATGVLYFSEQFKFCLEAFEEFLKEAGYPLQKLIHTSPYLIPIVHAEGDYFAPLLVDDEIEVHLSVSRIGTSSFTLSYLLHKQNAPVGKVSIVHTSMSRSTKKSIPLPQELLDLLIPLSLKDEKAASSSLPKLPPQKLRNENEKAVMSIMSLRSKPRSVTA
jgi:YbgC/YbaW family acyl-CoA thioester hydrolase